MYLYDKVNFITIHFNSRKILTKFRISDHKLEIEIGRYKKVPREQRICKACKVLDDEKHFFLQTRNPDGLCKLQQIMTS
jgi:hypothetical protein